MVTTGHQKLQKMGQNSKKSSFFAQRAAEASFKGQSPPQDLEVGPRSGPYLLVDMMRLLAPRENGKNKGVSYPNIGANFLKEAPTLGANNLFHNILRKFYYTMAWQFTQR